MPLSRVRMFFAGLGRPFVTRYAAVFLWSTSAAVISVVAPKASVYSLVTLEYTIAAIALLVYRVLSARGGFGFGRGTIVGSERSSGAMLCWIAGFSLLNVTHEVTFFLGLRSACPFEANIVNYLWPLWLFWASRLLLDAKASRGIIVDSMPLVAAFFGTAIMLAPPNAQTACGFSPAGYGFASSVSAAGYMFAFTVLSRRYQVAIEALLLLTLPLSAVVLWALAPVEGATFYNLGAVMPTLCYLGIGTILLPEIIWANALRTSGEPSANSFAGIVIPLLSTLWLAGVKDEVPNSTTVFGIILIILSIAINGIIAVKGGHR